MDTLGGKQTMICLSESGVAALVMCSRKPAARRFRRFITGEVIPQLIQCGTFVEGATPAERIVAAGRRIRQERAAMLAADTAALEAGAGLALLCVFRAENFLPDRDALELGRRVARVAKAYAVQPRLMFIRGQKNNPVKVWPRAILRQAADSLIPRLPFYPEGGRAS